MIFYAFTLTLVLILCLRYLKVFQLENHPWLMPIGFSIKILSAGVFFSVYSIYYGGDDLSADAGRFFHEGKILANVFYQSPIDYFTFLFNGESQEMVFHYLNETRHWAGDPSAIINDSKNLVKIHSVFALISFGYYPIHLIFSCFISLFGVYHLTIAFKKFIHLNPKWLFIIILIGPSTLFWTSGILKEPFLFFGIGLFCRALMIKDQGFKRGFYFVIGSFLLLSFKPYTLICILIGCLIYFLFNVFKQKISAFIVILIAISTSLIYLYNTDYSKIVHVISDKQSDFIGVSKGGTFLRNDSCFFIFKDNQLDLLEIKGNQYFLKEKTTVDYVFPYTKDIPKTTLVYPNEKPWEFGYFIESCGSAINVTYINNSPEQLIKNIPQAFVNATFRPYLNDPGSNFKYLAFIEILLILSFLIYTFINRRALNKREFGLVMALIAFSILMLVLIGWTTPVLGAIVRYRFTAFLAITLIGIILLKSKKTVTS